MKKPIFSRSAVYRIWQRRRKMGEFPGTAKDFLAMYGHRPSNHFVLDMEKGWVLKKRYRPIPVDCLEPTKPNRRNRKHGYHGSPTYWAWTHQKHSTKKFTGTFAEFLERWGKRPGKGYRFSVDTGWYHKKDKSLTLLWKYLTIDEMDKIYQDVKFLCERGSYDFDEAIDELYRLNIEKAETPFSFVQRWVKVYLPRTMSRKIKFVPLSTLDRSEPEHEDLSYE